MAKVLVTGGAGYIGSHACKALAAAGHDPIVYDNLSRGHEAAVRWGPLEIGDIRDRERLASVLRRHRPTCVMHFAAYAYVGESVTDPGLYYDNNVAGSLTLLRAMIEAEVGYLVFSSTCAIFGIPDVLPITEDAPKNPINPYGATKLMVERMLGDFGHAYGLRSTALRYFNAAGADPSGELVERHDPETHAIPLAILAALGRGPAFNILGTDYPTPDGTAIRDYIHVSDLATAHVLALDRLLAGGDSAVFNLGVERGVSVREVVDAVGRRAGRPTPVVEAPRRPGDPPRLVADARRAREQLGWRPALTGIDDIVDTAWTTLERLNTF